MAAKCSTAALLLALSGCAGPKAEDAVHLLIDDLHRPDILRESRIVEPPPSLSGNRFLRGWFPWEHQDTQVWVPHAEGAVVEIVNLSGRPRTLDIESRLLADGSEGRIEVEIAGVALEGVPLATSTRVPLPGELPLGRIPVHLTFDKGPDPVVLRASLDSALPPGEVRLEGRTLVQEPSSLVDFVRPSVPGARLVGRFSPPDEPRDGQRFAILLDRGDRSAEVLFEWTGTGLDRWRGDRWLALSLPGESEFLRLRLLAEGSGPPARWLDLGLAHPERTDAARRPEPSPSVPVSAPRLVVLYVLDALRADFVDLDAADGTHTPTLARLADEGVVFDRHLSVAPNTIPSTKSLFTGQAFRRRGHAKLSENGPETLAEAFAAAGYRTAAFSGNGYISEAYGTSRGFEHLAEEVVFREYTGSRDSYNDNAERVHRSALAWLDELPDDERAFLYLHTIHPHNPYDPPSPIQDRFTAGIASELEASTRNLLDIKHNRLDVTPQDQERITALYAGAIAYNDEQISIFLDRLMTRMEPEEILLIVTSDHGEELFDHGGVLHGYTLYREQLHIPLILWWPGRLAPQRIAAPTDNLDLHESLRALIGAGPSRAREGAPFWPLIGSASAIPEGPTLRFAAASSVQGGIFMAASERYKLIFAPRLGRSFGMGEGRGRGRDPEYLFDLRSDPGESTNRAGLMALEPAWMRSRLSAWIERGERLEKDEEEPVLDEETRDKLRALGYLE